MPLKKYQLVLRDVAKEVIWLVMTCLSLLMAMPGNVPGANPESPVTTGILAIGLDVRDGWPTVIRVLPDTSASRAGLAGGERILAIDGKSTENKPLEEVGRWLAGTAGQKIALKLVRPVQGKAEPVELTVTLDSLSELRKRVAASFKRTWTLPPTKEAGPVEWHGNKIVSRVLPYPDFVSFFIRLPIAHAVATGRGGKVAVVQPRDSEMLGILVQNIAPHVQIVPFVRSTNDPDTSALIAGITTAGCRLAVVPDPAQWPPEAVTDFTRQLSAKNVLVVTPSDLSEEQSAVDTINTLEALGALTVGRVNRQSSVMAGEGDGREQAPPINKKIGALHTSVFSAMGLESGLPVVPVATAAGVAALVLERRPELSSAELRQKLMDGARKEWQMALLDGKSLQEIARTGVFSVDPVSGRYLAKEGSPFFHFRVLDAAGALGVDTESPWFLNMLNCPKAWEITKGQGIVALVTDQGFHVRHPELAKHIVGTNHFGWMNFTRPDQNFHGTDMSRILLSVAPEAKLVLALCSGTSMAPNSDLVTNIAKSFQYAAEIKADVASGSWAGWFNRNETLLSAVRQAVDSGVVVSWFHYPKAYPGLLRTRFAYGVWDDVKLGFSDRFLTDRPGVQPVEVEAGMSGTAPQAAGLAALVKSVNKQLTPWQVEKLIMENATPIGDGVFIPDAYKTVLAAKDTKPETKK